jgi:glycosyltransferase involved in cell wall biosynthesis
MKVLVTVKHLGIKKLLLPALAQIKDIQFDVLLHNKTGLASIDDLGHLNLWVRKDLLSITYPQKVSLVESLQKEGINLNSYNVFILAGGCSIPEALKHFSGKLAIYTVAPFYRALIPEKVLASTTKDRGINNTLVVHSTPYHSKTYKKKYEYKYIENDILIPHGLNPQSWLPWEGATKDILTVWGGYKSRIMNKALYFDKIEVKGKEMIHRLVQRFTHLTNETEGWSEDKMRELLRECYIHLLFMKDQQTIGLVESLATGTPLVGPSIGLEDIKLFIENGVNGFFSENGNYLRENIKRLMGNRSFAQKISDAERDTANTVFNFKAFVRNWKRIITDHWDSLSLELPACYKLRGLK